MINWTKLGLIAAAVFASLAVHSAESQRVTSLNQAEIKALISAQSTLSSNNTYFATINNHGVKQLKLTHQRMQQFVLNTPIWGQQLSIQTASQHVSGFYAANLDVNKLKQLQTQAVNEDDFAQAILKKAKLDANTDYELHETKRFVYLENGEAVFAQLVQLEIELPNEVLKPTALITEHNNKVVKYWNDIHHAEATGPGGNEKMGRLEFGEDLPAMQVTQNGDTCFLENEKVKTVSLEGDQNNTQAFSFPCSRNTHKEINGAYSPLNEAHAYGTAVFDMYNDWYGTAPLSFQLLMRVHYGNSYENAFWDGSAMTFGDGASQFHPLTSLDIVSHEVSHGFTNQNSNLIYDAQSGGINEAFSDIAGEAAEFFLRGENDWLIGADVMKTATALRYFETPSLDGNSIDHADDYYGGIDVHYSSGVFNRAFYLLANTERWDVRKAFDVMVRANQQYWVESTNFVDGACGVINSAIDLGYEIPDVVSAFEQVGVECDNIQFIDADQDGMDDNWELLYGLNPSDSSDAALDLDFDTLTNLQEYQLRSLPNNTDSDNDGLQDGDEVNQYNTSPTSTDSDSDRMPDGWEVQYQLDPTSSEDANLDSDEDGFSNVVEYFSDTDPTDAASFPEGSFEISYNFEDGLVPENFIHSDPSTPWFVTEIEGNKVLTNNDIGDSQLTSTKFEFVAQQGSISFDYKTDTEQDYDYLKVYLNGEQVLRTSGQQDWRKFNAEVLSGANEIEFVFDKDSSVSTEADAVYIDNIFIGDNTVDTDQDGMPDFWEIQFGLDINDASDATGDLDNDGLSNLGEYQKQTLPNNPDSDFDGMPDGWEVQYGLAPTNPEDAALDADNDGFSNLEEFTLGTEPNNAESFPLPLDITTSFEDSTLPEWLTTPDSSDAAWMIDTDMTSEGQQSIRTGEITANQMSSFVITGNFDEGVLLFQLYQDKHLNYDYFQVFVNEQSFEFGFSDKEWTTESISIPSGLNTITFRYIRLDEGNSSENLIRVDNFIWLPNGSNRDSDNDGMPDLWEIQFGLDINDASDATGDLDNDGLSNLAEYQKQTLPNNSDSDADGMPDGWEVLYGLSPTNPTDAALDADNDGFNNLHEYLSDTDPTDATSFPESAVEIYHNFEDGLVPENFIHLDPSTPWFVTEIEGNKVLTNNDIGDSQLTSTKFEFVAQQGSISFDYKTDTEQDYDYLKVYLNGEQVLRTSGQQDWRKFNAEVLSGANEIEFVFDKDSSVSTEADAVYIDNIFVGDISDTSTDSDQDGMPDFWEVKFGLDINDASDATGDLDNDGLSNLGEYQNQTLPNNSDSDSDSLPDGWEVQFGLAPTNPEDAALDADNDGFSNLEEFILGTEPDNAESFPLPLDITTSFEDSTLPEWLTTPDSSNAAWVLDTDMATDGQQSIRSGEITSGQTSSFVITGYFDEGLLLFQSYINIEQGNDFFAVIVNGEYFYSDFTVPEWKTEIINIPSGLNTIVFLYYEDTDNYSTDRFVILDNFIWLPNGSDRDSDGDGMPDLWEIQYELDANDVSDATGDLDNDGLSNLGEYQNQTLPNNPDSDSDSLPDGWEVQYKLDANDASDATGDLDNDGLSNLAEYQNQTAPNNSDSDSDGMPDGWEVKYGFAPTDPEDAALDSDNDGFSNLEEFTLGTEPDNAESFPIPLDITTSFEGNTLPEWLTTPDSSNAAWLIDTEVSSEGQQSIHSGDISDNERSSFVVSGLFSAGQLFFDLYQDTESCCDYLQISINDEEVYTLSGVSNQTWSPQHISIPDGVNTIEFSYRKEGSISSEEDLVRLDNFVWLTNSHDTDNDGLPDVWELEYGLDRNDATDAQTDADFDGLTALQEFQVQTSPNNADSDSDLLPDGFEVGNTLNPLDAADAALDNDGDSYTNLQEFYANSDVNSYASLPRQISQLSEDFEGDSLPEWFVKTADSTAGWELSTEWHQSGSQSLKVSVDDYNNRAGFVIAGEFEAGLMVFDTYRASNMQVFVNDELVKELNDYYGVMSAITISSGFNIIRFVAGIDTHIDDITFGYEIPADRDSDSDDIPDIWELLYRLNPRNKADASWDHDGDGLNNLSEYNFNANPFVLDTDNDGVQDSEDSHPNDSSLGENQVPIFGDLSSQTIEANGPETWLVSAYKPLATDNGHLEPEVYLASGNTYPLGEHVVTWRARDHVGNTTEDHFQTIFIEDTTAPTYYNGLYDVVVNTHAHLEELMREMGVFHDLVDSLDLSVSIDPSISLHAGNRRIPALVSDKSGNFENHLVDVGILPELIIPETLVIAKEGEISLPIVLDGETPSHMLSFTLIVDGRYVSSPYFSSDELKLSPQVRVKSPLLINGARIKFTQVFGAYLAEQDTSVLSVKPAQYTPNLTASLVVDQLPTSVVESTQTYAELRFFVEDLNVGDEHEVEVSPVLSSGNLDYHILDRNGFYGFNPSELAVGTHNFTIKVTETNTESPLSSEIVLPITIVAPLELTDADTDNDGISDAEEGVTDRDRDGIVDYLDAISSPSIATLGDNQSLNVLDMSARVTLGQVKSGLTDGFATDMSITAEMVEQYSETAFGSAEQLFDPHYRDISKIANVTAVLLANNTSATLSLQSQITTLIDTTPKVRALTSNGWITLEEVQTDESCTNCVAFNVTDGGDMDLDGVVNGQVDVVTKLAVADANRLPELVFEAPESINENTSFELDASQSFDLDKDEISYTWSISNAAIELEPKDGGKVTLTVGELAESIDTVLTLVLNDGYGIVEHEFNITFNHVNALPIITLVDVIEVDEQTAVAVSASATDKESTSLSYEWTQKTGMVVEIQDATSQTLAFTAPSVTADTELEFELAVNDGSDIAKSLIKFKVLNNQTDDGSTDGGSTDGGSTDGGSTDGGSTDSGNTNSGNTNSGNTNSGNTNSGNTNSASTSTSEGSGGGSMPVWLLFVCLTAVFVRRRTHVTLG